jgi:hypothetical protein
MNKKLLNIALVLLLSGCSSWYTKPDGERVNKNAPVFVTAPNTNKGIVNKPVDAASPATVTFQAEKYIMVKESDLSALVEKKANDKLKEIKSPVGPVKPITNEKTLNNAQQASPAAVGDKHPTGEISPTVETVQLTPVTEKKEPSAFMNILVILIVSLFVFGVGYMAFFKPKEKTVEAPKEPVVPKDPPAAAN